MKRCVVVLLVALGCQQHDVASVSIPAASTSSAAPGVVDLATTSRCVVSYGCGMSHPGLGTSMDSTTVDLGPCTKTRSSASGPYDAPLDASTTTVPLQAAQCDALKGLLAAITADDAKREQESALIDMPACSLTVTCKPTTTPVINVQRQTQTGDGNVTKLIQALQRAH